MKNIILIGFMGSGKTTIGKELSYKCQMPLLDTDRMIETEAACSISQIFATHGEETFRAMETGLLQKLCKEQKKGVFSTGGGMPLREENAAWLKQLGVVVWLRISPVTAYQRLKKDTTRPILQCDNPEEKIRQLIADRKPVYESVADVIVDVDGKSKEMIVEEILCAMEECDR